MPKKHQKQQQKQKQKQKRKQQAQETESSTTCELTESTALEGQSIDARLRELALGEPARSDKPKDTLLADASPQRKDNTDTSDDWSPNSSYHTAKTSPEQNESTDILSDGVLRSVIHAGSSLQDELAKLLDFSPQQANILAKSSLATMFPASTFAADSSSATDSSATTSSATTISSTIPPAFEMLLQKSLSQDLPDEPLSKNALSLLMRDDELKRDERFMVILQVIHWLRRSSIRHFDVLQLAAKIIFEYEQRLQVKFGLKTIQETGTSLYDAALPWSFPHTQSQTRKLHELACQIILLWEKRPKDEIESQSVDFRPLKSTLTSNSKKQDVQAPAAAGTRTRRDKRADKTGAVQNTANKQELFFQAISREKSGQN